MEKKNETEGEKRGGDTCMKFGQNISIRGVEVGQKKKKKSYTSPTFRAEAGTLVRVTADITAAT